MKACVTGGTGFVGSYVVRHLLAAGHTVRVLHRETSRLLALDGLVYESALGDITDTDSLRRAFEGCDWVFHVAAVADYWQADRDWMFTVNVDGTRNVLDAARDAGVKRVVFTSSAAAIGFTPDGSPADESIQFNLPPERFPYGHSKVLAEQAVQEAIAQYEQDIVIVNPAIVIGPRDLNLISGTFIVQLAQNQWLTPLSNGGVPVIDVRDVAAGHVAAAEKGRTGERYILNNENYDTATWLRLIADVIGVAKPLITVPSSLLPVAAWGIRAVRRLGLRTPIDADQVLMGGRKIFYDARKAHNELHQPQIEMRQSVEDSYQWYLENGYIEPTVRSRLLQRIGKWWS